MSVLYGTIFLKEGYVQWHKYMHSVLCIIKTMILNVATNFFFDENHATDVCMTLALLSWKILNKFVFSFEILVFLKTIL